MSEAIDNLVKVVGTVGVIASLLFVGYEIKQSRDIALAEIYQQRTAMWLDMHFNKFSAEQFQLALEKITIDPTQMTATDRNVIRESSIARFAFYENSHYLNGLGLISEEEWRAVQSNIAHDFSLPCNDLWWEDDKANWRRSFVSVVEDIRAEIDRPDCAFVD